MTFDQAQLAFRTSPSRDSAQVYLDQAIRAWEALHIDGQSFAAAGVEIGRWCRLAGVELFGQPSGGAC